VPHDTIRNNNGSYDTTWSQHDAPPIISLPLSGRTARIVISPAQLSRRRNLPETSHT
jgi:hypothetical protein